MAKTQIVGDACLVQYDFVGEDTWFDSMTGDQYEKDLSGKWWVFCDVLDEERGPFNSLEHACECIAEVYEKWGGIM